MTREIKFKAWDKENKKWAEYHQFGSMSEKGAGFVITGSETHEISQYTGLKDKNGKEIYEGDVVHKDEKTGEVWTVEYDESQARFTVFNQLNSIRDFSIDLEHQHGDCPVVEVTEDKKWSPEIIGNIYENPELIND